MKRNISLVIMVALLLLVAAGVAVAQVGVPEAWGIFGRILVWEDTAQDPLLTLKQDGTGPVLGIIDADGNMNFSLDAEGSTDDVLYFGDFTPLSAGGIVFGDDLDAGVGWAEASDALAMNVNTNCETGTACSVAVSTVTTGTLTLVNGSLVVGNGTPDQTQDGEDAYIEGMLEVDGSIYLDGDVTLQAGNKFIPEGATYTGSVFTCKNSHDHTDAEVAVILCHVPANANIIDVIYTVDTQWNDGTGAVVDCGINGGDVDAFVDNMDINDAADFNRVGDAADMPYAASLIDVGATAVDVQCQVAETDNDASAGEATLYLTYLIWD